jgi:hypothetical protein
MNTEGLVLHRRPGSDGFFTPGFDRRTPWMTH